ncbi:amidohydrolase [Flavihumibacter sp. ZG627]|uniref:amidohydrolase n=1 Tax=Flavihumibacter sp. ZG627 TaxID=1463156 RepID=UPI00057F1932|nr:amidohydrolase [Flavihumibacter sp. ZG627]KIC89727.1 amidohydrolase [Flavihumibacter sp. ZG627]
MINSIKLIFSLLIVFASGTVQAQKKKEASGLSGLKQQAVKDIDSRYLQYKDIALAIWEHAELGYKEVKSSALLQKVLLENGFTVEAGVAGIPTAFVATYGSGQPVIGILAEFDALPGLSQQAIPEKLPAQGRSAGHGCGHNLFGTASVAAGIELKQLIDQYKWKGTIKVYGTPAEEGGSGKVYMVREGLFKGVDAVIHWHPGDENAVWLEGALANKSAKFRFYGTASHASSAPDKGRSALDGVEAMNNMVNMMREHIPSSARIHYVITQGGKAPNVVPEFAEVYYYSRHPNREVVKDIFDRIAKAAEGAALGTGTRTDHEIVGGTHDILLNKALAEVMHKNMVMVGGVHYSAEEQEFARKLQAGFGFAAPPVSEAGIIKPYDRPLSESIGSTDVGDVSWNVPTVGMAAATWVPGTPAHSWQAVACGGTEIGTKGMMVAAKAMTLTAIDLFNDPAMLKKAMIEFELARGENFQYTPLLGDRKPALNYRD